MGDVSPFRYPLKLLDLWRSHLLQAILETLPPPFQILIKFNLEDDKYYLLIIFLEFDDKSSVSKENFHKLLHMSTISDHNRSDINRNKFL